MKYIISFIVALMFTFNTNAQNAMDNAVIKNIFNRKSVRNYIERPIGKDTLELLVKAAMAAPTAGDKRPWAFIVITDKIKLQTLAGAMPYGKMLNKASAAIVVCGIPSQSFPGESAEYWIQDCSAATENLLLAVEALNLGAVWIGVYPSTERIVEVNKVLEIPTDVIPLNIISIGIPTGKEKPKDKYNATQVHWEKW